MLNFVKHFAEIQILFSRVFPLICLLRNIKQEGINLMCTELLFRKNKVIPRDHSFQNINHMFEKTLKN